MTDFDAFVDRRTTDSVKWDRYRDTDIIPLWVADMDFPAPPAVRTALETRIRHDVYGYGNAPTALRATILTHLNDHHHWSVQPEWLVWLPGLVTGLNLACRSVGSPGDAVLTMTPVYPPFLGAPGLSGRQLVTVPLSEESGPRYIIDWAGLEATITPQTRLLLFCNPHNPVGLVYSRADLERLGQFCEVHDLVICADEVHAGLILERDKTHISIASVSPALAQRTITLLAPSKTFNMPGLGFSFAVIPNSTLRARFRAEMKGIVPDINVLAYYAAQAAYREGEAWRQELIVYLRGNRDMVVQTVSKIPTLKVASAEATYLAWIDARRLPVENPQRFFEQAGLGLSDGGDFGAPGFVRLNFGCRRALLKEALQRLAAATAGLMSSPLRSLKT